MVTTKNFIKCSSLIISLFFVSTLFLTGCSATEIDSGLFPRADGRTRSSFAAQASRAMVVTENKRASEIGLSILKQGGNAFDAAIAVSFALSVLRPQSTGLGGGGFFLLYEPSKNSDVIFLDARERAPSGFTGFPKTKRLQERNPAAYSGIPGLVQGLEEIYLKHSSGKFSFAELIAPSIPLAENWLHCLPSFS